MAAAFPGRALVGGDEDIGAAIGIELGKQIRLRERADAVILEQLHGEHPLAGGEHDGFVQRRAVPEAARGGPDRFLGVGVFADGGPQATAAVEVVHRLIEEKPEPAERVGPEIAHDHGAWDGQVFGLTVDDEAGLRPGRTIVVTGGGDHKRERAIAAGDPRGPEAAGRRAGDADGHAVVELVVVVVGERRSIEPRRDEREDGDFAQNLEFKGARGGRVQGSQGGLGGLGAGAYRAEEQGTEGEKDSGETHGGNEVVSEDRRRMTVEETVMGWREAGSLSRGGQIDGSTIPL